MQTLSSYRTRKMYLPAPSLRALSLILAKFAKQDNIPKAKIQAQLLSRQKTKAKIEEQIPVLEALFHPSAPKRITSSLRLSYCIMFSLQSATTRFNHCLVTKLYVDPASRAQSHHQRRQDQPRLKSIRMTFTRPLSRML